MDAHFGMWTLRDSGKHSGIRRRSSIGWKSRTPTSTGAWNTCSSLALKTVPDGWLIVFYNHAKPLGAGAFFPRTPLCYAVSSDGGKSWSEPVLVDESGVQLQGRQITGGVKGGGN